MSLFALLLLVVYSNNSAVPLPPPKFVSRMLKKSLLSPARPRRLLYPPTLSLPRQPVCPGTRLFPCGVLAALRGSTSSRSFSEVGNAGGAFPFAKTHYKRERPTRSAVRTSSLLRSLRPCMGQGASRRARVGWVRSQAFLSILCGIFLLSQTYRPMKFRRALPSFFAAC